MVERRVTETQASDGSTHTHTEVYHDSSRRSGGAGWAIFAILLIAVVAGAYLLMQGTSAEVAKDNAVAEAAGSVSDAAQEVGAAAGEAADQVTN